MKNLLKKTFSILIALAVLLCCVSAFAEETGEAESVNLPVFEIGRGMSGTISPDSATEIKAHAGRKGQVQFTLTLAEDCDVSAAIDGGGVPLMRADANSPVYTFIKRFEWNEYAVISMTSSRTTGYSLISEILPEEPAPEEKLEETPDPAPEEKPAEAPDPAPEEKPAEVQAPASEPEAAPAETVEQPVETATETAAEPQESKAETSATETVETVEAGETVETEEPIDPTESEETEESQPQESTGVTETIIEEERVEQQEEEQATESAEEPVVEELSEGEPNEEELAEPTIQLPVESYSVLKTGRSISDTLVAGQKVKLQVKCGKNNDVKLVLNANPDDINIDIEGSDAQFTQAADGSYVIELNKVAFHKFNITLSAQQDLAFTLSAKAASEAEAIAEAENEEETEMPADTDSEEKTESDKTAAATEEKASDDASMLALGYYKVQVANAKGAEVYQEMNISSTVVSHLETGAIRWMRTTTDPEFGEVYAGDGKTPVYILWDAVIITTKPEQEQTESDTAEDQQEAGMSGEMDDGPEIEKTDTNTQTDKTSQTEAIETDESIPARYLEISSTMEGMLSIPFGTPITMTAHLINFREDDVCAYQWQYLDKETDTYIDIEGANEATYTYDVSMDNFFNSWKLVVILLNGEE